MKTVKQTVALFRDEQRHNIPLWMIEDAMMLSETTLRLVLKSFSGVCSSVICLGYHDEEVCEDDYRKLLRAKKRMNGQKCQVAK